MALFGGLLRWGPYRKSVAAEAPACLSGEPAPEAERRPPLLLLVPDTVGGTSFQLRSFFNAKAARKFLEFWLPGHGGGDKVVAFWSLTWQPAPGGDADTSAEAVVLIRDASRPSVVYVFSFSEMIVAQRFARQEVECGLDPSCLLIYWAVPVNVETSECGKPCLTPATPPVPPADSVPFGHVKLDHRWTESEMPLEGPGGDTLAADGADLSHQSPRLGEKTSSASARDRSEALAQHEPDPAEAMLEIDLLLRDSMRALQALDQRCEEKTGEGPPSNAPGSVSQAAIEGEQPTCEICSLKQDPPSDIIEEVRRVLRVKRWDPQPGPFRGFDSPPGKF